MYLFCTCADEFHDEISQIRSPASTSTSSRLSKSSDKSASTSAGTRVAGRTNSQCLSSAASPMTSYRRDVVLNNVDSSQRDAKTAWARRCVKKHTKLCQGQYKLRRGSKDAKEDLLIKAEPAEEKVKFSSEVDSKQSSLAPLTVNTSSSDFCIKMVSTPKFSPGASPSYVSTL